MTVIPGRVDERFAPRAAPARSARPSVRTRDATIERLDALIRSIAGEGG